MPQLRLSLAQVNPTVGDLAGNAELIRRWSARAAADGAQLVAFPEMVLTGYPVEDLALRASFVRASRAALARLASDLAADGLGELPVVVGYLDRVGAEVPGAAPGDAQHGEYPEHAGPAERADQLVGVPRGSPQNCAAVLYRGRVAARYAKHHLPNYGVFDEFRIFVPGRDLTVIRVHGIDVALAICEDLWQDGGPVARAGRAGAGLLLVINGSPYEEHKDDTRLDLVTRRSAEAGCPLAYVNMVGGQDDLVFDGDSIVVVRRRRGARPGAGSSRRPCCPWTWTWPPPAPPRHRSPGSGGTCCPTPCCPRTRRCPGSWPLGWTAMPRCTSRS